MTEKPKDRTIAPLGLEEPDQTIEAADADLEQDEHDDQVIGEDQAIDGPDIIDAMLPDREQEDDDERGMAPSPAGRGDRIDTDTYLKGVLHMNEVERPRLMEQEEAARGDQVPPELPATSGPEQEQDVPAGADIEEREQESPVIEPENAIRTTREPFRPIEEEKPTRTTREPVAPATEKEKAEFAAERTKGIEDLEHD